MPKTTVVFYKAEDGTVPVLSWLLDLRATTPRAAAKCIAALQRLQDLGHELRRPEADTLRDGISELRIKFGHVNYRLLYAIHERVTAVVAHAVTKEARVLARDIDLAIRRIQAFGRDPTQHTYFWEIDDDDRENEENF